MAKAVLDELKHLVSGQSARETLPFRMLPGGIPRGAITEVSGKGKTEFVLRFLRENAGTRAAWIEKNFSAYPFAFVQNEIDLQRILFIEGEKDVDWCVYQALRAQVFHVVVIYCEELALNSLRRIQLQSEKSLIATLWLTNKPKRAWPVHLQIEVERHNGEIKPIILRRKA